MGLFGLFQKKTPGLKVESEKKTRKIIENQIQQRQTERRNVLDSQDLTPPVYCEKNRKYHYKDVNIWVNWQHSGHYGKSCESVGMKRGDIVDLVPHSTRDDPEHVTVLWNGIEIGAMKTNRLCGMIHQWKAAGLPVFAVVSQVGGIEKLFIEIAFYGFLSKK